MSTLSPVGEPGLLDLKWLATTVNRSPSLANVCAIGSRALNQTGLVDESDRIADRLHDVVLVGVLATVDLA